MKFSMTFCQLTPSRCFHVALASGLGLFGSVMAIAFESKQNAWAQEPPSAQQVVDACVSDQVFMLPNPYSDVPSDHWVYEAVLKLYYCGVIRPGLPPDVIERLTGVTPSQATAPAFGDSQPSR